MWINPLVCAGFSASDHLSVIHGVLLTFLYLEHILYEDNVLIHFTFYSNVVALNGKT